MLAIPILCLVTLLAAQEYGTHVLNNYTCLNVDKKIAEYEGTDTSVIDSKLARTRRKWRIAALVWLIFIIALAFMFVHGLGFSAVVAPVVGFIYIGFISSIGTLRKMPKDESRWKLLLVWPAFLYDVLLSVFAKTPSEGNSAAHGGI